MLKNIVDVLGKVGMMGFGIMIFLILVSLYLLIYALSKYYTNKSAVEFQKLTKLVNENQNTDASALDQLEFTISIMNLVDNLIENEVKTILNTCYQLNVKYETTRFDSDIKNISEKVFSALIPEVYESSELLVTSEYLQKTIAERATYILIDTARNYNTSLNTYGI